MNSQVFNTKLVNHKIFDIVKGGLKNEENKIKNLMEIKDDILYLWNSEENCFLTLNLKNLEDENAEAVHQILHLTSTPPFSVERVLISDCGTKVCVWGTRGAVIVELPSRWNKGGNFDDGKATVLCKSFAVEERLLYSHGDVRRVLWHPDSISHLLVLLSDNTIRLYNISVRTGRKLVKILNIGPKPSGLLAGKKILESLGDTAVDFTVVPDTNNLLILRGNGDVYMIMCSLDTKSAPPKLFGPLTMYPPADDNYGEESCSIAAMRGRDIPPVVVIATSGAQLYHCLLLPEQSGRNDTTVARRDWNDKHPVENKDSSYVLYVVEAVELNIVVTDSDYANTHSNYPVHLYPCGPGSATYICVHAAGVHTVTLPIINEIKQFALFDEDPQNCLNRIQSTQSIVRYTVSTHTPHSAFSPPVGTTVHHPHLALLDARGRLTLRTLEPYGLDEYLYKELQMTSPSLDKDEITQILKERQKVSFASIIQELLTRDVSLPIFKTATEQEPAPKESLEFLTQATLKLRKEYISRQERALEAIRKKILGLVAFSKQQREWFSDLEKEISEAYMDTTKIRAKCLKAEQQQEILLARCLAARRSVRSGAGMSRAEREIQATVRDGAERAEILARELQLCKARANTREQQMKDWEETYKKKNIVLGKSHSDTISSILQQQTSQISNIVEQTKILKEQLNIV